MASSVSRFSMFLPNGGGTNEADVKRKNCKRRLQARGLGSWEKYRESSKVETSYGIRIP